MRIQVNSEEVGRRVDTLVAEYAGVSVGQARRWITSGRVLINARVVTKKGDSVSAGDVIELDDSPDVVAPDPDATLDELQRGEGWVVINKSAGVPVHPLREHETGTALNALAARDPDVRGVGEGGLRSGVVHRLDLATSGCLVFATRPPVWNELRCAFAHETDTPVIKTYRARVGAGFTREGEQVEHLRVLQHRPARVGFAEPDEAGARHCSMSIHTLREDEMGTLLEVDLHTGFLHQVRAMCAGWGWPILGDSVYGGSPASRLMLHAHRLRYTPLGIDAEAAIPDASLR